MLATARASLNGELVELDKLIAAQGGVLTPEVSRKAGPIFERLLAASGLTPLEAPTEVVSFTSMIDEKYDVSKTETEEDHQARHHHQAGAVCRFLGFDDAGNLAHIAARPGLPRT